MKILIAEDDFTSRALLSALLKKAGHEVLETVDGIQALEELRKENAPRLAILDWMMSEMDGLEVVQAIRRQNNGQPLYLIMLTTRERKEDVVTVLEAGADDYLTKPFNHFELVARINVGQRILDLQDHLAARVEELQQTLDQVNVLRGLLPICCACKKIRDDKGFWEGVESYIARHTEADFSHGICPDCMKELYPEIWEKIKDDVLNKKPDNLKEQEHET